MTRLYTTLKSALFLIVALQVLNMSLCMSPFLDESYGVPPMGSMIADPTETVVEWIVEMKMGQQERFTYKENPSSHKNMNKYSFQLIDLEMMNASLKIPFSTNFLSAYFTTPVICSRIKDITYPPPKLFFS